LRVIACTLLIIVGGLPSPLLGADEAPLRAYFESVTRLTGSFEQTTRDERDQVVERSTGTFSLARPDRFHWFYQTPFEQRLVSDGDWLYSHDIELSQVTVRPLEEVLGVGPAVVLSGDFSDLKASFRISAGEQDGWYRLEPRDADWDFQSVRLRLDDGIPDVVAVNDGLGQTTRLELADLERNPDIPEARFRFEIPDGVDVIAPDEFDAAER
jgi:chaperone LolA